MDYRITVLHARSSRGGSNEVHTAIRVGDDVEVRGPRNHFQLLPAKRCLFIAGGIGITLILPMIERSSERGIPWVLA